MKKQLFALLLLAPLACASPSGETPEEWISLFDGKTLAGWKVRCKPKDREKTYWKVDDGTILCDSIGDKKHDYVWLMTEAEYGDFELQLQVRGYGDSTGNSGVQIRSRYDEKAGWLDGPQVDIHPPNPFRCGLIYDETRTTKRWIFPSMKSSRVKGADAPKGRIWKADGWNDLRILCRGTVIRTWVNGLPVADYDGAGLLDDKGHQQYRVGLHGHIALQLHSRDSLRIRFRNLKLKRISPPRSEQ